MRGPASDFEDASQPLRPLPPIGIKWDYEGSTYDLGDLGRRFPHRNTTLRTELLDVKDCANELRSLVTQYQSYFAIVPVLFLWSLPRDHIRQTPHNLAKYSYQKSAALHSLISVDHLTIVGSTNRTNLGKKL